jgi:dTDP-4-dehydrorhamnose 3,5-epimerase
MESMVIEPTAIPGCFVIKPKSHDDQRGKFVKTFHRKTFQDHGLEAHFHEEYYTISINRVLRGLHFQKPPHQHNKLVYCPFGNIFDVVLDLRFGSPTYRRYYSCELSDHNAHIIYVPKGLAHGFYVKSEKAVVVYNVSTIYSPDHDDGILWNSAEIPWPDNNPIISDRDRGFITLANFVTPFRI